MNIFVLDLDPEKCAHYHNDTHVNKMLIEACQLLCSAHHVLNSEAKKIPYKLTHENHPCSVWVRESFENYKWLTRLALELAREYRYRRFKEHASEKVVNWAISNIFKIKFPKKEMTPFVLVMPEEYKVEGNPVESYRFFYIEEKQGYYMDNGNFYRYEWTNRNKPEWWIKKFMQPYKIPNEIN